MNLCLIFLPTVYPYGSYFWSRRLLVDLMDLNRSIFIPSTNVYDRTMLKS